MMDIDGLDELEQVCLNEHESTRDYRRNIEKELKDGLTGTSFVSVTLNSYEELLCVMCFSEIKPDVLKKVAKGHGLRLIQKNKTLSIDCYGPVYKYVFISNKREVVNGVLNPDLTKADDDTIIFSLLDEKNGGELLDE